MRLSNRWSLIVMGVLHGVGLFGLMSPLRDLFLFLTPVNLMVTAAVLWFSTDRDQRTATQGLLWALIFMIGWAAEWFGVHTGWLFGDYAYGSVLGPRFDDIPLVIGVNWVIVTAGAFALAGVWTQHRWWRVVLASVWMVVLDIMIEPVAMHLDFWQWADGVVPLENYLGWLMVSILTSSLWSMGEANRSQWVPKAAYFVLLLFFITLNLAIHGGYV